MSKGKVTKDHILNCAFELASKNELSLVNSLSLELANNSQMLYPYSEYMMSMKRGYQYFKQSFNGILNINALSNIFNNKAIKDIVKSNNETKIWQLISTEIWLQKRPA